MSQELDRKFFFLPDLCQAPNILFLVLIAQLLVLVLVLFDTTALHIDWISLALSSLFVQWLALSSAALLCGIRSWLMRFSLWRATSIAYALILLITLIYSLIGEIILYDYEVTPNGWGRVFRNLIMSAIVSGIGFRYFYLTHQLRHKEQAELTSRIQALQSRIRPHFLFNSMNIIASLIPVDPDLAEKVVEDLSVLFRASLHEATSEPVSLEQELDLCRKYLHIEGLRLNNRLNVEFQLEADPSALRIPLLTLQPLLENAIYHGVQPLPKGGTVTVNLKVDDHQVQITITNPLSDLGTNHKDGNRMAIDNVRRRMNVVCGPGASLTSKKLENRYVTQLIYPKTP